MAFAKKTIRDIELKNKKVLVSVDYNVPAGADGRITSNGRVTASLPTINYLLKAGAAVCLVSHRGRPGGKVVEQYSLRPVTKILSQALGKPVNFVDDCIGQAADEAKQSLKLGEVLLLENTRFHEGEEANNEEFGRQLAGGMDFFVQDAFGNAHRCHGSTDAVTHYLKSVAGLLVEREVDTITAVMSKPQRPLMAIIGGAKISDKIDVINSFIDLSDFVAIGGAMANTFLLAEGISIGKSMAEKDDVPLAKAIINKAQNKAKKQQFIFYVPQDGVVATGPDKTAHTRIVDWNAHVIAEIENYPKRPPKVSSQVKDNEMILDIGPFSGAFIAGGIQLVNTVIWNGTMGVTETPSLQGPIGPFAHGTDLIIDAMLGQYGHKPFSVVGGGDTAGYIQDRNLENSFDHVSTGGGASLALMSGKKLPAIEALQDK